MESSLFPRMLDDGKAESAGSAQDQFPVMADSADSVKGVVVAGLPGRLRIPRLSAVTLM
jgi:hypothetical protein